jgi:hypothetical protein
MFRLKFSKDRRYNDRSLNVQEYFQTILKIIKAKEQGIVNTKLQTLNSKPKMLSNFQIKSLSNQAIIFTTISFINDASEVPVSPTPTPFKL